MANTRAILLMTAAMAFFALTDTFIKLSAETLQSGQILFVTSAGSAVLFLPLLYRARTSLFSGDLLQPSVVIRTAGEIVGSLGIVVSLSLIPFATVSAVLQAQPLAMTLGAALFLRETVGWRRWMAVALGLVGVLIILRPGMEAFDPNSLWMLLAIFGLTARDLGTRILPAHITTAFVSTWAMLCLALLGLVLMPFQGGWQPIGGTVWIWLVGVSVSVSFAFLTITAALRMGEVSSIAPFRYTRIIFALAIAYLVFGESIDGATWAGAALIIGSGLYAFWRERRIMATSTRVVAGARK